MTTGPGRAKAGGSAEDLAETVRLGLAKLPLGDGATSLTFTTSVVTFVQQWLELRDDENLAGSRDAVFVLVDRPRTAGEGAGFDRIHFFAKDPRNEVRGRIFLCASSLQEVYAHEHGGTAMSDAVIATSSLGFGDLAAVVFSPALKTIQLCPLGVNNEEASFSLSLATQTPEVTLQAVDEFLTQFHGIYLRTPQKYKRFWEKPSKYVPVKNAEKEIQSCLVPMAMLHFRPSIVRYEEETFEGRADLTIAPDPTGASTGSAVLELKALRSRYPSKEGREYRACSENENKVAVVDGIDQANRYRNERRCNLALVCCYDFREADEPAFLDQFQTIAAERNVHPRRYRVYNEAAAARRSRSDSAFKAAKKTGLIK